MPRPFKPTEPLARFVVQAKSARGRESFPAQTAPDALSKVEELLAQGRDVQVFSERDGLMTLDALRALADAS